MDHGSNFEKASISLLKGKKISKIGINPTPDFRWKT
jgi:hypothetical protein